MLKVLFYMKVLLPTLTPSFFKKSKGWLFVFFTLLVLSLLIAGYYLNIATATYLLLGAFFYGYVYTILLKRSSIYNIVIGGLAGSFAVLAGSASVSPILSIPAIMLSLILFLWTLSLIHI